MNSFKGISPDLDLLFGPEQLVEDLGIPLPTPVVAVELAASDTTFDGWYEARAAVLGHRPKVLPRLSPERHIHWWFEPYEYGWKVVEFTLEGEREVGRYASAARAYELVISLRDKEKKRRAALQVGPKYRRMPQPPFICSCRARFDTAEELLAHRCGPPSQPWKILAERRARKESQ